MAAKPKAKPYQELGLLIESWRAEKFRSALALFKEAEFSFSYRIFADFESGATLPSLEAILELARFFGKDETIAIFHWVRAQLDSEDLRARFVGLARDAELHRRLETASASQPQPSFENTWIFGLPEKKALLEAPWLSDVFAALLAAFPNEVAAASLPLPDDISADETVSKYLSFAIQSGYVIGSKTGLKLRNPYIHLPRTEEWSEVRCNNIRRALEYVLGGITEGQITAGTGHRELTVRKLSSSQAIAVTKELKDLELKLDLILSSEAGGSQLENYALVQVFGRRNSKITG